ncbi:MAG: HEAT repeat domain-containing protein [Dehalococcoidia bacterium]|nr:HEAT repeat domain-containing protein [Dehalococcoidia bacterium]
MVLSKVLADLADKDKTLVARRLSYLSALSREEIRLLDQAWPSIEVTRRRQIVSKLVDLAEDNPELDYNAVFRFCLRDQAPDIRVLAIEGLWECEARWLMVILERLVGSDPAVEVRAAAAVALGRFARMGELGKLKPEESTRLEEVLFARIDNPEEPVQVRRRAIEAAGHFNLDRVTTAIEQAYDSPDRQMRVSSLHAMGRNAESRWLPTLIKELENEDPEMRYEAARACSESADSKAAPYLIPLMDDPDAEVQMEAIHALGKVGGTLARRALRQRLHDPDERLRRAVELALEDLEATRDPFHFEVGG